MEQSPSWEANRSSAGQGTPRILWDAKVYYCFHQRRHLSLSQARSIQCTSLHHISWRAILILSLPSRPRSSMWSFSLRAPDQNSVCTSCVPHMCHMLCQSHSSWFVYANNILWGVQIIKNVHLENVLFKIRCNLCLHSSYAGRRARRWAETFMRCWISWKVHDNGKSLHVIELLHIVTDWFAVTNF